MIRPLGSMLCPSLLAGCPSIGSQTPVFCHETVEAYTLVGELADDEAVPAWGRTIDEHALFASTPFTGSLTYDSGGEASVTLTFTHTDDALYSHGPDAFESGYDGSSVACLDVPGMTVSADLATDDGALELTFTQVLVPDADNWDFYEYSLGDIVLDMTADGSTIPADTFGVAVQEAHLEVTAPMNAGVPEVRMWVLLEGTEVQTNVGQFTLSD